MKNLEFKLSNTKSLALWQDLDAAEAVEVDGMCLGFSDPDNC